MIEHLLSQLRALPEGPHRIILHWTGGGPEPNESDMEAYHAMVGQSGRIYAGVAIARNMRRIPPGTPMTEYAAHAGGINSWSVGVALCGMREAVPGGPYGPAPITEKQLRVAVELVARMVQATGLSVEPETVMTHWEVYHLHRIGRPGKWDITELPWDPSVADDEVGPLIREQVRQALVAPADFQPEIRRLAADVHRPHGTPPWRAPLRPTTKGD